MRDAGEVVLPPSSDPGGVGASLTSSEGRFLWVDDALCALLGRTEADLLGLNFADVTHPDDLRANHRALAQLHRGSEEMVSFVKRYVRPDGEVVQAHVTVTLTEREGERCYVTRVVPVPGDDQPRSLRRAEQAVAATLLAGQAAVLEGVVRGTDLASTLEAVTELAQQSLPGVFCALHLLAPEGEQANLMACLVSGPNGSAAHFRC